jgi:cell division protein FtsL
MAMKKKFNRFYYLFMLVTCVVSLILAFFIPDGETRSIVIILSVAFGTSISIQYKLEDLKDQIRDLKESIHS